MPKKYVVKQGEGVDSIAFDYGFAPLTIWEHVDNEPLRRAREDRNILRAGDVLMVPDKKPKSERCATARRHTFRRRGVPAIFRLQLCVDFEPRRRVDYVLTVDGTEHRGTTDDEGVLQHYVSPNAALAVL